MSGSCVHTRSNRQVRGPVAHLGEERGTLRTSSLGIGLQCPLLWADTQWHEENYEDTESVPSNKKAAGESSVEPGGKEEHKCDIGALGRDAKQAKLRHGVELEEEARRLREGAALAPGSQSAARRLPAQDRPSGTGSEAWRKRPPGKLSGQLANGQPGRAAHWRKVLVYPTSRSKNAVTVTNQELNLLDSGDWANDTIVDFHVLYIQEPTAEPHARPPPQAQPTAKRHPEKACTL